MDFSQIGQISEMSEFAQMGDMLPLFGDITKLITFVTSNLKGILTLIMIGYILSIVLKFVNKTVQLISSILFIILALVKVFGVGFIQSFIANGLSNLL